jgi:hypothetical protein
VNIESTLGKPTVAIITEYFRNLVEENAAKKGMPHLRFTFVKSPVWGKTPEQLQKDVIEGTDPVTGKPVMPEIVSELTTAVREEDKTTRTIPQSAGPDHFGPDTAENLQKLFREKGMTDYLPIVLPTEEKVDAMLKATSHKPDEIVGKISPTPGVYEYWSYTVRQVAVNAVMAGADPEYFPVILAIAAADKESMSSSDNSFAEAVVINGPIRDEIGLNYGIGALGPFSHANATIGRAYTLLSINAGNCGKVGETYMGVIGNPANYANIVIAENEKESPWRPFSVRKGFKPEESVVSIFEGWGVISAKNSKYAVWQKDMNFAEELKNIFNDQDQLFGGVAVLSPAVANYVKAEGYDTVDKLTSWLYKSPNEDKPHFWSPGQINILVTGSSNNLYWDYGGMRYVASVSVDKWR